MNLDFVQIIACRIHSDIPAVLLLMWVIIMAWSEWDTVIAFLTAILAVSLVALVAGSAFTTVYGIEYLAMRGHKWLWSKAHQVVLNGNQ